MILLILALVQAPDTIRLSPGVYPGPLVLERRTVVLADSGAVLRGSGKGTVLTIRGRGSEVRGLRIEGSGRDPDHYDAGILVSADSVVLDSLVIRDVLFGVYLKQVRGVVLRQLDIAGQAGRGEGQRGDGITFYYSRGVVAQSNRITDVRDGMYFSYSDSVVVTGNRVSHVRFGLHYMFSHENRFTRNVFTDNAAGAVIMNSRHVHVTDNVFAWNAGSRSYGLVLQQASDPIVNGNLLVGNGIGVFFDNVIRGTFTDNLIAGNWLGIHLFTNSEETRISDNTVVGNTFDASGGGTEGAYRLCVNGRGNYWAAAARDGYDLAGDGVLDAPHAATSPLAELALNRDGLRLFLNSPAARALAWAERTFPVFDAGGVTDSCPLAHPPQSAMLAALPSAPAAHAGGRGGQSAAGLAAFALGVVALVAGRRRPR